MAERIFIGCRSADGRLVGRIWLNGEQAEWPAVLQRQPLG
jgi:hypothetical protein